MIYASLDDLKARIPPDELLEIADRDASGAVDGNVINAALADASEEIDSYLRSRYDLPLPTQPPVLVGVACTIARYRLHMHAKPEHVQADYDRAIATLRDYAKGVAALDIGGTEAPADAGAVSVTDARRVFSRESLREGW